MLMNQTRRRVTRRSAFTLLEVLVVVAILVILAGVASISIFRYMEDAKVSRARADMAVLEKAYKTYYSQHGEYPQDPTLVYPLLEQGAAAFESPWSGVTYVPQLQEVPQVDGTVTPRIYFVCQPPGGKPPVQYPER